jgi:hypothetical protein
MRVADYTPSSGRRARCSLHLPSQRALLIKVEEAPCKNRADSGNRNTEVVDPTVPRSSWM